MSHSILNDIYMNEQNASEDIIDNEGSGGNETKFVEVDGKKFTDDGTGKPKVGADGLPEPFVEVNKDLETPEARKFRLDRMQEQHKKKHPELYEPDGKAKKDKKGKSDELDYSEKAFLLASGIKGADEMKLVQEIMNDTGKTLDTVLESRHFQAELKELRDTKAANDATPTGSRRQGQSASDTVEYWIAKGQLPPVEQVELRRKVVNARYAKESNKSNFTDNPVASNR